MKFYELIELGSTLVKAREHGNTCYDCCVIGTAAAAVGARLPNNKGLANDLYAAIKAAVGPTAELNPPCPACKYTAPHYGSDHDYRMYPGGAPLLWLADHLHTSHRWDRQRIAEFIKPIEDAYELEGELQLAEAREE